MAEPDAKPSAAGSPFWRFSLRFYRMSGVAEACITLQERSGVDVNLLLYLLWQASQCHVFAADDVAALEGQIAPWRAATVIPLRTVRRALKEPPSLVAGPAAEALVFGSITNNRDVYRFRCPAPLTLFCRSLLQNGS